MTDSTDSRLPKHPRLDYEDSGGGVKPEPESLELDDSARDKELWLDDGNLVLVCGGVMFKVYRGLLVAQSLVFGDMFAVASSSSGAHLSNVPTVRLTDSPEDLRHLLRALVPSTQHSVFKSQFGDFTIHQLSTLVRLAHKYQIDDVQKQAITALRISYPSDFQAWEKRDSQRVIGVTSVSSGIEVMSLARLIDEPKILPSAFYTCTLAGGLIVDGWRREDGTLQTLDNGDLKKVINGFGALRQCAALMLSRVFDIDPAFGGVQTPGHCRVALTRAYLQEAKVGRITGSKLLHSWKAVIGQWAAKYAFCEMCAKVLEERSTMERKALWDVLPAIFGLTVDSEGWVPVPP